MQTETPSSTLDLLQEEGIVRGSSPAVAALNAMVEHLAKTTIPVLLVGDSGTGKEVYARSIHALAGGNTSGLKKVSCAAVEPAQLAQILKELSAERETGKVQSLFLDAVEELSPECQKLLLANGEFLSSSGSARARVISATTVNLDDEVAQGRFRRELYFRLNGARLRLPALRERVEDIPSLIEHFLRRHAEDLKKAAPALGPEALDLLASHPWPGNIRELENVARKMVALGDVGLALVDLRATSPAVSARQGPSRVSSLKVAAKAASRQTERELILQALQRTKWNRKQAARELQISYKSLLYKLKQIEAIGSKNEQ